MNRGLRTEKIGSLFPRPTPCWKSNLFALPAPRGSDFGPCAVGSTAGLESHPPPVLMSLVSTFTLIQTLGATHPITQGRIGNIFYLIACFTVVLPQLAYIHIQMKPCPRVTVGNCYGYTDRTTLITSDLFVVCSSNKAFIISSVEYVIL